ncbi:MAG: DUF222 domain-containing protein [Acidimicrobiales bacterium]|nr:DUF222 domain-containing protein [Acidimicrobiales bacterium]
MATLEDAVVHLARTRAMVEAAECEALAAFEASKEWKATGAGSASARVAHVTGARRNSIGRRCHAGVALRAMPHTEAAFAVGDITLDHVEALAKVNVPTLAVRFAIDEEQMVGWARELDYGEFYAKVQDWRDAVAPEDAEERARSQVETRELHLSQTFEGMGRLDSWLDPLSYREVADELERHEKRLFEQDWAEARERFGDAATKGDLARSPAQRRVDALREMARASKAHGGRGAAPTLGTTIVCDDDTFLTCLARLFAEARGTDPDVYPYSQERRCEFARGGRVTPEQAVMAGLAGWLNVLVLDAKGFPLKHGRRERFFPQPLREALMIVFRECLGDACDVRSVDCEIDHILAWIDGGTTDDVNGQPLCKRHNRWKERLAAYRRRGESGRPPQP